MKKYAKYLKKAKKLGAQHVRIIPAKSIVTAEWVRLKCQFGCGGYGRSLLCPPRSPTPEQTRKMITDYKHALLIHGGNISKIVFTLERDIFLDGYYKAFGMGAGPCSLCKECSKLCKHPGKARPSLESCGIDVYRTVRNHGLPIKVLKTPSCQGNYYGIVLIA